MTITRRQFTSGALTAGVAVQLPTGLRAQSAPAALQSAIAVIRTYAEAHMRYFNLPGMTLGVTMPDGFGTVLDFGYANLDARTAITPATLFQIGSITKCMTAALIHQLAAEGRLSLADRVSVLAPGLPLPAGNAITLQHLLDHTSGLPDSAPLFPAGGLWTGFAPGAHWAYSNTGYDILGKVAEQAGGKPLGQLFEDRLFRPLGMRSTRGAISGRDRTLYAQGYEAADTGVPYLRGVPLAPAAWVDVTGGEGCVASTAADMSLFMRSLANAAQGRGGLGLGAQRALAFTRRAVPSDTPGATYGNGLMHVAEHGRSYLHHTGGMVSFSSSFHLDTASGVGAFASSPISAFAEYRPRLVTRFAVDALTEAAAGRPLPKPPAPGIVLANAGTYIGRYSGVAGAFEVKAGSPLAIVANGQSAPLEPVGGELFRTTHPAFRDYSLQFRRTRGIVTGADWGPASYARDGAVHSQAASDPALARLAGRYVNDSPWWGVMPVVERGGRLWIGTETPMTKIGDNLWRVGQESWSPERAAFADELDGRPQTLILSGERFKRHDL